MTPAPPPDRPDVLCVGAVLWDVIGRSTAPMRMGSDVPGRITRAPGGVAMNIAATLRRFGLRPALLCAIGRDADGEGLVAEATRMGLVMDHAYRSDDLLTDRYMAIEGPDGLVAAVADAHSLEAAGDKIMKPLENGILGSAEAPWEGLVVLDGNLTADLLARLGTSPLLARSDLRVAPASPGKAERLLPLLGHPGATIYVNLEEAGLLCQRRFRDSAEAAQAMVERGARRVLVTDESRSASDADAAGVLTDVPPTVNVRRVTGAGDTFMAAHIVAERGGDGREASLLRAVQAAAFFVSGDTPS